MDKGICIYHGNCVDGFGAAWAFRHRLKKGDESKFGNLKDWEFYPGTYGKEPPDVKGRMVVILDFSYKKEVMQKLVEDSTYLLVLDHHESASIELEGLEDWASMAGAGHCRSLFDMDRSGAMLSWDWFHPRRLAPRLIEHIQDRDLWRFKLDGTRDINMALFSYPYDFELWDKLMVMPIIDLINEGVAIGRKHDKDVAELLGVCRRRMVIGGVDVPVASLPYTLSSDAGHIMGKGEKFAACYYDTPKSRCFSLRSAPDGMNVSEVARVYGGGGHRHAAGFEVPLERLVELGLL